MPNAMHGTLKLTVLKFDDMTFDKWYNENKNGDILYTMYQDCTGHLEGKIPTFKQWCREYYEQEFVSYG